MWLCTQAAGGAFGILFKGGGGAVDQVVPSLLASLSGDNNQQVMVLSVLTSRLMSHVCSQPTVTPLPIQRSDMDSTVHLLVCRHWRGCGSS